MHRYPPRQHAPRPRPAPLTRFILIPSSSPSHPIANTPRVPFIRLYLFFPFLFLLYLILSYPVPDSTRSGPVTSDTIQRVCGLFFFFLFFFFFLLFCLGLALSLSLFFSFFLSFFFGENRGGNIPAKFFFLFFLFSFLFSFSSFSFFFFSSLLFLSFFCLKPRGDVRRRGFGFGLLLS